jgi:hypothetical protein
MDRTKKCKRIEVKMAMKKFKKETSETTIADGTQAD